MSSWLRACACATSQGIPRRAPSRGASRGAQAGARARSVSGFINHSRFQVAILISAGPFAARTNVGARPSAQARSNDAGLMRANISRPTVADVAKHPRLLANHGPHTHIARARQARFWEVIMVGWI